MRWSSSEGDWFMDELEADDDDESFAGFGEADYGDDVIEAELDDAGEAALEELVVGETLAYPLAWRPSESAAYPSFFRGDAVDPYSPPEDIGGDDETSYAETQEAFVDDFGEAVVATRQYREDPGGAPESAFYAEDDGSAPFESDSGVDDEMQGTYALEDAEYSAEADSFSEYDGDPTYAREFYDFEGQDHEDDSETDERSLPSAFRMGVWLDVGGRNLGAHMADHVAKLKALRIKDACVMVNSVRATSFGYGATSKSVIGRLAPLLRGGGIDLTLTSWLRPDRAFIDALVADLPAFATSIRARAIEFDVEGPWIRHRPRGFSSHAEAADHLFRGLAVVKQAGIEIAVTCLVDPMTHSSMRRLLELADVVVPQAYSAFRASPAAAARSHGVGGVYGPRGIQNRAVDRLDRGLSASASKDVIMGLAAYNRGRWPGHSATAIMDMEANAALALAGTRRVKGIRYWSWKWIAGHDGKGGRPANSYSGPFLNTLATLPARGPSLSVPAATPPPGPTAAPSKNPVGPPPTQPER